MKVLQKNKMPDGTIIQIEDWSEDYKTFEYASTVAAYPISKYSFEGQFVPKAGEIFRCSFNFVTTEDSEKAYSSLIKGETILADYADYMNDKRYKKCIETK